jgi:hypothetical protein
MERAGRLLGKVKLPKDAADVSVRVRAAWKGAAGKKVDEHTRVAQLVRTTLVVEVEDMVWQRQLNALKHFLVRNLNEALGGAVVTDIDFRPMPARMKPQRASQHASQPADQMGSAKRKNGIQDPVLALLYQQSKNRNTA